MTPRFALFCVLATPIPLLAQSIESAIQSTIDNAAKSSVSRDSQARQTAEQAYQNVRADSLLSLDPKTLYSVQDDYDKPWSPPSFGPRALRLLGSSWLDSQTDLNRDALIQALAHRMIEDGYIFFRIDIVERVNGKGPEIELVPQKVKLVENGLQLKNIIRIQEDRFFRMDELRLALFQLNQGGESSYKADLALVEDTIYLSFQKQQRAKLTSVFNINNYNKRDLYGYAGTATFILGDFLNMNESMALSYSGNLAAVDARSFEAYNGYVSVPILGTDLMFDYGQSTDKSLIPVGQSSIPANRATQNMGAGLRWNMVSGDSLLHYGARVSHNNSRFSVYDKEILAQTYRYTTAEISTGISHQIKSFNTTASLTLSRALSYDRGDPFTIARTHMEISDRLPRQFRYRVSLNGQKRLGSAPLPSSELFYPNSPTRIRLPFEFAPMAAEDGMNVSATLSYDSSIVGLHRGWVAVGQFSPFIGVDHGRAGGRYATSISAGINYAIGQNNLQIYLPKVVGSNLGHPASSGVFMALQAQF